MSFSFFSFKNTPKLIKYLIITTFLFSFVGPFISFLLHHFRMPGFEYLSLSLWGIKNGFFWQPISYLFISSAGTAFAALISLIFNLFIIWSVGTLLYEEFGAKHFFGVYFGSGIFGGLCSLLLMNFISPYESLSGPSPSILALLFLVSMLYHDLQASFFFVLKLQLKWIIFIIIGISLFGSLLSGQWVLFSAEFGAILFSYLYATILLHLTTPFSWTHSLDRFLHFRHFSFRAFFKKKQNHSKIIHFKDEIFMEEMLEKISKKGKDSLSKKELKRMKSISKKKQL